MTILRRAFTVLLLCVGIAALTCIGGLAVTNALVLWVGGRGIVTEVSTLPRNSTGLVLGTSPRSARGAGPNPFFENRMDAAAALFHAGVVRRLLLSGDNRHVEYNEPVAMRDALRERGLPDTAMALDYAGFRTLDSVVRAREVFKLEEEVVVITDDFHLPRALFLAHKSGLKAVGYAGKPVPWQRSFRTRIREWFSRTRACLDVYVWKTRPHFLGDPVSFPEAGEGAEATRER